MYKIIFHYNAHEYVMYGFTKTLMRRLQALVNNDDDIEDFELIWIFPLCFSWKTFKKCWKCETERRC